MSVFLIGYRGSGKSTVGRRLADRLWQEFLDSDELIIRQAGMSIREIFEREGEAGFRDHEATVVRELAALPDDHVIALGGGAVLREENRQALRDTGHKIIYLRCEPAELHRRIHADPQTAASRPALTHLGGSQEEIERLLAEREPIYRACMTAELDVTSLMPEEATTYIARLL